MNKRERVYLLDFDNTLFDTVALKKSISDNFKNKFGYKHLPTFWKIYSETSKKIKYVDIQKISKNIYKKIKIGSPRDFESLFLESDFPKFVFKHTGKMISMLKKKGKVILYSLGDTYYQPVKIRKSGVGKMVGSQNIFVSNNKFSALGPMILDLKSQGFNQITILDDKADILEKAKRIDPNCVTVLYDYGEYKKIIPKNKLSINYQTDSPENLIYYLGNFVSEIKQNSVKDTISVVKDISNSQIRQLVRLTRTDSQIKKFTHDKERFASQKSFASWKSRGKNIYTMIGHNGKLLGIIWFCQKTLPSNLPINMKKNKCRTTFAIRNYPPARHKGLAAKFMNDSFKDFFQDHKKVIWLSTNKDNKPAVNLYERFGFKKIKEAKDGQIYYLYS